MFASNTKKEVPLAGGICVTIRKLSGRSLEKALEARQIQVMKMFTAESLKAFRELPKEEAEGVVKNASASAKKDSDKYALYDRHTVLVQGIHSWGGPGTPETVTPEAVGDLEEPVAALLYKEIIDLSIPDPVVAEKTEKNA
jgi:hypothetical protein